MATYIAVIDADMHHMTILKDRFRICATKAPISSSEHGILLAVKLVNGLASGLLPVRLLPR